MERVKSICSRCRGMGMRLEYRHGFWSVVCVCCNARTPYKQAQGEAIDAWNEGDVRREDEGDENS